MDGGEGRPMGVPPTGAKAVLGLRQKEGMDELRAQEKEELAR